MVNPAVSSRNKAPTPSRPSHTTGIPRAISPVKSRAPVAGPSNSQRLPPPTTKPPSVTRPPHTTKPFQSAPRPPSATKPTAFTTKSSGEHDETIKRLQKELSTLSTALNSERASHATYTREVEALQSAHRLQFARLQEELAIAQKDYLEAQLATARATQGRLKRDFAIAQFQRKESELDAMLDEAEERDELFAAMNEQMGESFEEMEELRRQTKEADKAKTDAQAETARLRTELNTLKTSLERAELKHQSTLDSLTEATKRKDELSRQIQRWESLEGRTDSQAQELQKKLADVEHRLIAANKRAEEAEEKAGDGAGLQEQIDVAEAQMKELKKVVKKIKGEGSTLADENEALQARVKELEAALAKASKRPAPPQPLEEEEEEPAPSTPPPRPKPKPKPRSKPQPPSPPPPADDEPIELDDDIQEIDAPPPPSQPKPKPKPKRKAPSIEVEEASPPPPPPPASKRKKRAASQVEDDAEDVFSQPKRKRKAVDAEEPVAKKAKKEKPEPTRKASGSKAPGKKKAPVAQAPADDSDDDIVDPNAPAAKKKQISLDPFKRKRKLATWGGNVDDDEGGLLSSLMGKNLSPVKDQSLVPPRNSDLRSGSAMFRR